MLTQIQEWGNSQGIRIPLAILKEAQICTGENVSMSVQHDKIVIEKQRKRKTIKELFDGYSENYTPEKIDWGTPEGKELW